MLESPKSQDQEVGLLVDRSVKLTVNGAVPLVGFPEKSATGGVGPPLTYSKAPMSHPAPCGRAVPSMS